MLVASSSSSHSMSTRPFLAATMGGDCEARCGCAAACCPDERAGGVGIVECCPEGRAGVGGGGGTAPPIPIIVGRRGGEGGDCVGGTGICRYCSSLADS